MLKCFAGAGPLVEDDEDDFVFSGMVEIPLPENSTAAGPEESDGFEYVDISSSMDEWEAIVPEVPANEPPKGRPKMIHRMRDAIWGAQHFSPVTSTGTLYPEKPSATRLDLTNGGDIVQIMGGHQVPVPHLGDLTEKLIWSTYRKFEQFGKSESTTDAHWGCMYRAAQMALTNTLLRQLPGSCRETLTECITDGPEHLFSLQNMVQERKRMVALYSALPRVSRGQKWAPSPGLRYLPW
eukprot:TRINITY_DN3595_c0_g1_i5.p1 TRINITY_DN3595_c0_g1~~TRINITY_DN3595_c0_g1_i5.p1  ORF type:complete len:238 (+),score=46.69 TRINITY_DN3595_c0_g1_i5:102-815(+)